MPRSFNKILVATVGLALGAISMNAVAAERASELRASPVDLLKLATLAIKSAGPKIAPASQATFERGTRANTKPGLNFETEALPVIPHDSDLLKGTVYQQSSSLRHRTPKMVAGRYRTVEYK